MAFKNTVDKNEFIKNYDELKSASKMAELYNVSKDVIQLYAKHIGYVNHYRFEATTEQIQYIINNYYLKSSKDIADEIGCSKGFVKKIWRVNGLNGKTNRSYCVDDNTFKLIDTPIKAYILGYIASDGCVYKRKGHIGMLSITCNQNDEELLNIVQHCLSSNYKISHNDRVLQNGKISVYSTIQINSDIIADDLSNYNIIPRKTWNYCPVDLQTSKMNWHFIRGYFDGDGSIYSTPNVSGNITLSSYRISITCNKNTSIWFKKILEKEGIECSIYKDYRDKYTDEIFSVIIRQCESIYKMYEKMYSNSQNIRLERKYIKFNEFINLYQSSKQLCHLE